MRNAVVVLNYRGRADTEACVASLLADPEQILVVVVDNGSGDGVLESVATMSPDVITLALPTNLGFSGGMNAGLERAIAAGADTITILNNDTLVPPGTVPTLAACATDGYAVSPVVTYADRAEIWFAGGVINSRTGLAHHAFGAELAALPVSADGVRSTDVLAGCCVCATTSTWQRVGLLDDRYFLNFEDSDWSVRARAAGVRLGVLTSASITHKVSASFTGAYTYLGLYYYVRNGLLFVQERSGTGHRGRARFVRHHVAPAVLAPFRQRTFREGARRGGVVGMALAHHLTRTYGRAPKRLERVTRAWAGAQDGPHGGQED